MLRRATEDDRDRLLEYLRREPEFNLFLIGDILNDGFDCEHMTCTVEERDGAIRSVLMRYRDALIPYTHDNAHDLAAPAARINEYLTHPGTWTVHGKTEIVARVKPLLCRAERRDHELYFCVCRKLHAEVPLDQLPQVEMATVDDAEDVVALQLSIEEFQRTDYSGLADEVAEEQRRIALIRDPDDSGRVIASAHAVAESDAAAMIIGVGTLAAERGKGYASACVYHLVKNLAERGKSACLFFDNPSAGRIYHRLGFRDIGMWRMLHFEDIRQEGDSPTSK